MRKETLNILCKFADPRQLDAAVVESFLVNNGLFPSDGFIAEFLRESVVNNTFEDITTIEDVISVFEQAVPIDERTKTELFILRHTFAITSLINYMLRTLTNSRGIDYRSGMWLWCFLYTAAQIIRNCDYSYQSIFSKLFGVDISANSVRRTKLLLALTALTNNEFVNESDLHIYCANSLSFDFYQFDTVKMNDGYDYIIGNPLCEVKKY